MVGGRSGKKLRHKGSRNQVTETEALRAVNCLINLNETGIQVAMTISYVRKTKKSFLQINSCKMGARNTWAEGVSK